MKHQARALRVLAFFICAPVCVPNVHQGQIPGLFIMKIKPCKCFAGLTACNAPDLAGIVPVIQPRARRHVAASRFACFARYWRIEASRFGAKRGSRCCELSRNEGLRCCGACCYGLGRLNTVSTACPEALSGHGCSRRTGPGFSGHEPQLLSPCRACLSRARAAVALAMPGLVFRGAGSNFSRRIGLGFPGMRAVAIAARRLTAGGECGERVRKRCANPTIRAALAMQKWQTRADAGQMRIRPL